MPSRDVKHMSTPPVLRGARWWLDEFALAERAVTMGVHLDQGPVSAAWALRIQDQRLDWLATVDDVCERAIAEVAASSPDVADLVRLHYVEHVALRELARRRGVNAETLRSATMRALDELPTPYPATPERP